MAESNPSVDLPLPEISPEEVSKTIEYRRKSEWNAVVEQRLKHSKPTPEELDLMEHIWSHGFSIGLKVHADFLQELIDKNKL